MINSTAEIALESFYLKDGVLPDPVLRNELSEYEMDDKIFSMTIERAIDEAKAFNQ